MKVNVKKFQAGGPMPEEQGAPMPAEAGAAPAPEQGGADQEAAMMEQLYQMAAEIIQQMGPEGAAMLAQAIMEMLQGGGGEAPMPAPEEQPVYRKGGVLVSRRR
jgi:hypothetical protein